jgi:hypothetical protein
MATPTVALRFRDSTPGVDTVKAHREEIASHGAAWWGWWKNVSEEIDAATVRRKLSSHSTGSVLLINRPAKRSFIATFLAFADRSEVDLLRVPTYYREHIGKGLFPSHRHS